MKRRERWVIAGALMALWPGILMGCRPEEDATAPDAGQAADSGPVAESQTPSEQAPVPPEANATAGQGAASAPVEQGSAADASASDEITSTADAPNVPAAAGSGSADMLSPSEADRAAELTLGSLGDIVEAATDRAGVRALDDLQALAEQPSYRVLYTQRTSDKAPAGRAAEVAVYRYDTGETVLSKVDLQAGDVTPLPIPPGYTPPLVPEEIAEAQLVAAQSADVIQALEDAGMEPGTATANGLLTGDVQPGSVCSGHRCIRLFYFDEDHVVPTFSVIVDLSALSVVEVSPILPDEGQH